jgi:hypothetical protein
VRHVFAALILTAILAPLVPTSVEAPMPCCRGTGQACSCPIQLGFARCQTERLASAPVETPLAVMPLALPIFDSAEIDRLFPEPPDRVALLPPDPPEPVPRG